MRDVGADRIGGVEREAASTSSYAFRLTQVNFSYTVVAADRDADGISIPANSIVGTNVWLAFGSGAIDRSHAAIANQSSHRVFGSPVRISATSPDSLTEATLNNATVTVSLDGATFASGVSASSFARVTNPAVSGLSVASVTGGASGSTSATLTLAFTGDISAPTTLAVRVLAAAHTGSTDVTSATRPISPTPPVAAIASPAILTAATLNNATLTVSLQHTTYASGVTAASFELVTEGIADAARSIASATATAGGTSATLAVKVLAAAHAGDGDLTTGKIDVLQGADTAPAFGAGSLSAQRSPVARPSPRSRSRRPPAATGPAYTASGLRHTDRRIATAPARAAHATDRLQSSHRPHHRGQETER